MLMATGPTEFTVKEPAPAANVVLVVERVTPPVPAMRLTAEPVKLLVVAVLRVTVPAEPSADAEKAPPPDVVMAPVMAALPVVAVAEKEPEEASVRAPAMVMALLPAALALVIDRMPEPEVPRGEVAVVENNPRLSALPAMKVPVPAACV